MGVIRDELRTVLGKSSVLDAVVGPLLFALVNLGFGLTAAVVAGLAAAGVVLGWRLARGGAFLYAVGGVGGTVMASLLAAWTGRAGDYYLPGIVSGAVTTVVLGGSVLVGYPLVAVVSSVVRRWPMGWFLHPRVKRAYVVVTWVWVLFFGVRTVAQAWLYVQDEVELLAVVRVATGWPAMVGLLVVSYLLGRRLLTAMEGPSVDEWRSDAAPPWQGQEHGF